MNGVPSTVLGAWRGKGIHMSEQSQGPGWWLASDGRWYPPETAQMVSDEPAKSKRNKWAVAGWVLGGILVVSAILNAIDGKERVELMDGISFVCEDGELVGDWRGVSRQEAARLVPLARTECADRG